MGLLNNNNHRRNKRASLRKQHNQAGGTSDDDLVSFDFANIDSSQQSPASNQFSGSGGDMMGYMQMAAAATPREMGVIQGRQEQKRGEDVEEERHEREKKKKSK